MEELRYADFSEQLQLFKEHIRHVCGDQVDRLCIFGAGEFGLRLYQELRNKLIPVAWFSDNNPDKWGYLVDNIYCVSPSEIEKEKERTLVIVANRTPDGIVKQLKTQGFPHVMTKQEIDGRLADIPSVALIAGMDRVENVDYSSEDVQMLAKRFTQIIYEICSYYESRYSR
ncbi:hypothetical protein [Cohnella sp. GCM10027633]|uniref:hypothetical protein n=1 Tax=unclassified Cohnella TaxID=2636738 RepID=UPI00364138B1